MLICSKCHQRRLNHPKKCVSPECLDWNACNNQYLEVHASEKGRLEKASHNIRIWRDLLKKAEKTKQEEIKSQNLFSARLEGKENLLNNAIDENAA